MIRELSWKEYREHRGIWLVMAALTVLLGLGLALALSAPGTDLANLGARARTALAAVALVMASTYGLVCGSMTLAGEREAHTLVFLDMQSGRRAPLWKVKAATGAVLTLAQALLLAALALPVYFGDAAADLPVLWAIPVLALDCYAWGLAASALSPSGFAAAILGCALLALTWLVSGVLSALLDGGVLASRVGLALVGVLLSHRIFCTPDRQRTALPAVVRRAVGEWRPPWRVLLWLTWRQARVEAITLLVAAFVLGMLLPRIDLGLGGAAVLLAGVVCGTAVFAGEQESGAYRFLGDQRLPLGRVWAIKTLCWFVVAVAAAGAVLLGMACSHAARGEWRSGSGTLSGLAWIDELSPATRIQALLAVVVIVGMFLVYGFVAGQLAGLVSRRRLPALVVGGAVALLLVAAWLPSLLLGGLPLWQLLGPPVFLLAVGRLVMWWWASDRLIALRPLACLCGGALLTCLWVAGGLWARVATVPDVGPPFDLRAFEVELSEAAKSNVSDLIRAGSSELKEHQARVNAKFAPPVQGDMVPGEAPAPGAGPLPPPEQAAVPVQPAEPPPSFPEQLDKALEEGWPKEPGKLGEWLDEMFAGHWPEAFRKAAAAPPGLYHDPRRMNIGTLLPGLQETRDAALLFAGQALQLQARGKDAAALEHLNVVLGVSRQIRHDTPFIFMLVARAEQDLALNALDRWLQKLGPRKELLRRALQALTRHEEALPPVANNVKAEYYVARNSLDEVFRPGKGLRSSLYAFARQVPWEKEREQRLLNLFFRTQIKQVELPYWEVEPKHTAAPPGQGKPSPRPGLDTHGSAGLRELEESLRAVPGGQALSETYWWPLIASNFYRHLVPGNAMERCRLRGERLRVALALYQVENGKPAAKLADLMPRYLPKLPLDPFSGEPFHYRVSPGERIEDWSPNAEGGKQARDVPAGQGVIWSVGPDRNDNGARAQGSRHDVTNAQSWADSGLDVIFLVPVWPKR